jgi:ferredoxin-NADP reductase
MMQPAGDFPARLVAKTMLCDDVLGCVFEAADRERFEFTPGQHLRLSLLHGDFQEDRYYSIASAPRPDNRFELAVYVGDDAGGGILRELKPGDELRAWGPAGEFTLREPLRDCIFVATGSGITPLRSMLESLLPSSGGPPHRADLRRSLA